MLEADMKVLCVYHDQECRFLDENPQDALRGDIVVACHSFTDASDAICSAFTNQKPFDLVIADCIIPRDASLTEPQAYGPLLALEPYEGLYRAIGIMVPHGTIETGKNICEEGFFLATSECWTITGARDWRKMRALLKEGIDSLSPPAL